MKHKYVEFKLPYIVDVSKSTAKCSMRLDEIVISREFTKETTKVTRDKFIELMLDAGWDLVIGYHSYAGNDPTYGFKIRIE